MLGTGLLQTGVPFAGSCQCRSTRVRARSNGMAVELQSAASLKLTRTQVHGAPKQQVSECKHRIQNKYTRIVMREDLE